MNNINIEKNTKIRLNRIKGQIEGISEMIDNKASIPDILMQISAARSALRAITTKLTQNYIKETDSTEEIWDFFNSVDKYF